VVAQQASGLPAGLPRFTSLFNYGYRQPRRQHDGGRPILGIQEVSARGRTNYPLTMSVDDVGTGLVLTARVVAPGEAALVCALLHTAVDSLVTALERAPGTPLRQLPVLAAAQRAQLLQGWNDTACPVPPGSVPELFWARAVAAPDVVAVACDGQRVSYGELAGRAARLARLLAGGGVPAAGSGLSGGAAGVHARRCGGAAAGDFPRRSRRAGCGGARGGAAG